MILATAVTVASLCVSHLVYEGNTVTASYCSAKDQSRLVSIEPVADAPAPVKHYRADRCGGTRPFARWYTKANGHHSYRCVRNP